MLDEFESVSAAVTVAVLLRDCGVMLLGTLVTIVIVAEAPEASVPTLAVTVPALFDTVPCEAEAELKLIELGKTSVTTTFVALDGPLLVTVTVYVSVLPAITGSALSVLAIVRSTLPLAVELVVAVLLAELISVCAPVTVAVLEIVPRAVGATMTTSVTVALAPLAKVPIVPVIVPALLLTVPAVDVPLKNETLLGKTSVMLTPVAVEGPALVT